MSAPNHLNTGVAAAVPLSIAGFTYSALNWHAVVNNSAASGLQMIAFIIAWVIAVTGAGVIIGYLAAR